MKKQGALTPNTIKDVYDGVLNIPIYQRLFVWEEPQIMQLLNDLYDAYKNNHPPTGCEKNLPDYYYIGIITLVKTKGKEKSWDIVDGQQRLTFLSLLAAYSQKKDFLFLSEKESQDNLRIHYFGRSEDEQDLLHICNQKISEIKNINFKNFLRCMEQFVKDKMVSDDYFNYVFENTALLISELPKNYSTTDLNLFFEKMNSAGRQLTPVEQIKGIYFAPYATVFDACLNFEERFPEKEPNSNNNAETDPKSILNILNENSVEEAPTLNETNGDRSILRPAIFLLHVLRLMLPDSEFLFDENKVLKTFKIGFDAKEFIEKMIEYRRWLDENIIYLKNNGDNSFEYVLREQEHEEDKLGSAEYRKKLRQFQGMLYVSSSNAQEWVLKAYRTTTEEKKDFSLDFLDLLKTQDNDRHSYLPEEKDMCYDKIDRYWFWRLDYYLWEAFFSEPKLADYELAPDEKKAIRQYTFRANRSIEHLHPQTPQNESNDWKEDKEVRDSFGNLAMISSSFNSRQGNDSLATKFGRVKDQISYGRLESIKMLLMFKRADGDETNWTPQVVKEHGEKMLKFLRESYDASPN